SRGGGDDDYDVCDGDKVVGRIVRHPQAPMEAPWFWVIIAQDRKRSLSDRGYAVSREQAIAQFRTQWSSDDLVCHRVVELPTPTMPAFIVRCVPCNAQIWVALKSPSDVRRICSRCARASFSGSREGQLLMSALGQKQTCALQKPMSALPPITTSIAYFGMSALGQYPTSREIIGPYVATWRIVTLKS